MTLIRKWKIASLLVLAVIGAQWPTRSHAQATAKDIPLDCGLTVEAREKVRDLWVQLRGGLRASAANPVNYTQVIYDMQIQTDSLLTMATQCNDTWLLDELSSYYLLAQQSNIRTAGKLIQDSQGHWQWPETFGTEETLNSSQFVAALADLYRTLISRPKSLRTANMQAFITSYHPILKSHVVRWTSTDRSMWIWAACGIPSGATERLAYSFSEFVVRRKRKCGPEDYSNPEAGAIAAPLQCLRHQFSSPLYCNAMQEIELFVAQAGADFVSADDSQNEFTKLTSTERTQIATYVRDAMALWESRLVATSINTTRCGAVPGYLVDPDGMKDHPTYGGAHWTGTSPDVPTAWDISHGRRFVRFLDTMYRNSSLSQPTIAESQIRAGLANMVACKIWASDNSLRFTSFMDGSNPGITLSSTFYPPWSMSESYMGGGFASWARSNSLLTGVNTAILNALNTDGDATNCTPPALPTGSPHTLPYCFNAFDAMNFRASLAVQPATTRAWHTPGDWNGDGRADIFIHNELSSGTDAGKSTLFLSNSSGFTTVSHPTTPGYDSALWKVAGVADFNGDGRTDLLIHARSAGHPDNGKSLLYRTDASGGYSTVAYPTTPGWDATVWESFVADFTGDGRADLLLHGKLVGSPYYGQSFLHVFNADGTHSVRSGSGVPSWSSPWQARGIADFNGDGKADVLLHAEQTGHADNGKSKLHLTTDSGYLTVLHPVAPGFDSATYDVKGTGDFDGDGRADLFLHGKSGTTESGKTWIYLFDEDGNTRVVSHPAAPGFDGQLFAVRGIADFDGDGRSDIMIHGEQSGSPYDGKTYLFLFDAGAATHRTVAHPVTPGWDAAQFDAGSPADWNGDGRADLAIHGKASGSYSGTTYIYQFAADGSSSIVTGTGAPSFVTPPWKMPAGT
jgi:hypothetical protein